jgi:hypothetical protein
MKRFFIFIYGESRGGIGAGAYVIEDENGRLEANARTFHGGAVACAVGALEEALVVALSLGAHNITVLSDQETISALEEGGIKIMRRFRVTFELTDKNPAKPLADSALLARMGW